MCWLFECGDGWERIIRDCSEQLEFLNDTVPGLWVVAVQVKEKFGTLRFYYSFRMYPAGYAGRRWEQIVETITFEAEYRSSWVCEDCGEPGTTRDGGWIRTLCDDCEAARLARLSGGKS